MNDVTSQMIAGVFKALSSPVRIKIIEMLSNGSLCVCKIIEGLGTDQQSNTSQHLNVLKNAGIVDFKKEGLNVIYSLKYHEITDMIGLVENVLNIQLEETKEFLRKK